jgi:hypothetical protein
MQILRYAPTMQCLPPARASQFRGQGDTGGERTLGRKQARGSTPEPLQDHRVSGSFNVETITAPLTCQAAGSEPPTPKALPTLVTLRSVDMRPPIEQLAVIAG